MRWMRISSMWTPLTASWTSWRASADPEQKRKIIGAEFIRVFEEEARKLEGIEFLAPGHHLSRYYRERHQDGQGGQVPPQCRRSAGGPAVRAGGAAASCCSRMRCAPCGEALGLPDSMVYRQPFPGPGLGVRCLGAITRDRLEAAAGSRRHPAGGVCQSRSCRARSGSTSPSCPTSNPSACGTMPGRFELAGHPPRRQHRRRHDGHHRGDPLRHSCTRSPPASQTKSPASTASSTTSPRSPAVRSNGSKPRITRKINRK